MPAKTITLSYEGKSREVKLKTIVALPAYFHKQHFLDFINTVLLGKSQTHKWEEDTLIQGIGMLKYDPAKMLYVHIHN